MVLLCDSDSDEPEDSNRRRLKKSCDSISKEFGNDNRNPANSVMDSFQFRVIGVICGPLCLHLPTNVGTTLLFLSASRVYFVHKTAK